MEDHVSLTVEQAAEYIRDDLDYLAVTLIPEEAIYAFPPFYRMVWALILQNLYALSTEDIFRFALGLPRGHVKTTFIKLLVCYLILHDYDIRFILIACATEPLAENFLSDVSEMLSSDNVTQIYGSWQVTLQRDTKKVKIAKFNGRTIILAAIGAQTSVRGLNLKNKRPNLVICDDVQTKENDKSPTERSALLSWLVGTLFKARAKVEKKAILYIGNMYSTDCILYKFSQIPNWTSLITGAILADGSVLWPEINTLEELLEEYEHDAGLGEAATWFAEIQNDPIGAALGLLDPGESVPDALNQLIDELDIYNLRFITVDPAGSKPTSDDNVIASHCLAEEGSGITLEITNGKMTPLQVVNEIIRQIKVHRVPIVFIESQGYQASLAFWLNQELVKENLEYIKVIPIPTGRASKYRRIKVWTKLFAAKKWQINRQEDYTKVVFQLYAYKIDKMDNVDDILDVLAQTQIALSKHYTDILTALPIEAADRAKQAKVERYNTSIDTLRRVR